MVPPPPDPRFDMQSLALLDGHEPVTAALLLQRVPPVAPTERMNRVLEIFTASQNLVALPIVADGVPLAMINRKKMIESFTRPYTRELFGSKPISAFVDGLPLVVDIGTDLDEISRIIMETDMQYMYDGFIITEQGRYAGIGTGYDLLRAVTARSQAQLYRLAHYDALTGLPNRLLLLDRLSQAMAQAARGERLLAVMLLDLDRFKTINDTLGHAIGDRLLCRLGERLTACVREGDTVARLGGDEFIVILSNLRYVPDAAAVAQKILDALHQPFPIDGHEIFVTPSIGIALYPFHEGVETLLQCADRAMYHVKEQGGNQYEFCTVEMNDRNPRRLSMETGLRRALKRGELELHYQPQVDVANGCIVGVEALLRWRHPELGLVPPGEFIPLAVETGQILPIGEWVLHTACAQARAWQDAGLPPLRMAVNVCVRQFHQANLAGLVRRVLEETGLDARWLELELTESTLMQNTQTTIAVLGELNAMGAQLSVDDFGTGYSSLAYLKRFPIDALKIDGSFVCDITTDPNDAAIVKAIIAMAHSLDMRVVAEAVETEQQLAFLREHRCHEVQGFLVGRPVPADELETRLVAATAPQLRRA